MSESTHEATFTHDGRVFHVSIMVITPEIATDWLKANTHNRTVTTTHVVKVRDAITRGEYMLNGETIVRTADGTIVDGQHRLIAVVESGLPITSFVIEGVALEAQVSMGTVKPRRLAEILQMPPRREKSANQLAASLAVVHRVRGGTMTRAGVSYPTIQQALDILEEAPHIRESLSIGKRLNASLKVPGGLAAGLHYLFSEVDAAAADEFYESLLSGEDLPSGHPFLTLRKNLEKRAMKNYDKERMEVVAAWMIKAWNAWWEGTEVHRLFWTPGGPRPEKFPRIKGGAA